MSIKNVLTSYLTSYLILLIICSGSCPTVAQTASSPADTSPTGVKVLSFLPDKSISRAGRSSSVSATISNPTAAMVTFRSTLVLPDGLILKEASSTGLPPNRELLLQPGARTALHWNIETRKPGSYQLKLLLSAFSTLVPASPARGAIAPREQALPPLSATLQMDFLPAVTQRQLSYIPPPQPVKTSLLIGAHNCPLWEADRYEMWNNILKHPERTPALGFYGQENPEVSDWETKWALEHGVNFFIYCWYRASQGEPVKMHFGSALHDALFKSRYGDQMKFTIMWENQSRGTAGVADEHDLFTNLLPFWIDNYFKRGNYLKVDNRPVLFIYRPEFLIQDLGGIANVRHAFEKMRQVCKSAGFDGLLLLGEYRGLDAQHLQQMKELGLDYTFAYCWGIPNSPTPEQAIASQMSQITETQRLNILPQVVTVSQAWSGWNDEGSLWKIPPPQFETLLRKAKDFVGTLPKDQLGSKMLLLDNWNEWGEGHYIAPYREYGFGYLDAVRRVFSNTPEAHTDLIPEDIGLGPYDRAYTNHKRAEETSAALAARKVTKPDATETGLLAWWAFDEKSNDTVALDYTGKGLGGVLHKASRAVGIDGSALLCNGGWIMVPNSPRLSPPSAMTIECWVKTDKANQDNVWLVNRVYGGGPSTGYRLGILGGNPCFEIPLTDWSHHLKADIPLQTGKWVHIAGTYDGTRMRIYVNGEEHGSMERTGPIHPNTFPLCLGSYDADHPAHFTGLLDEVKLYDRALTASEIQTHYRQFQVSK